MKTTSFRKLPNCVKTGKTKKPIKTNYTSNLHLPFSLIFSQATRDLLLLSIISLLPDANWIFLNKYWRNVQSYFKLSFLTASGLSYSQLRANVKVIASFTQCHYRVFIWDSTLCQQEFQRGIGLKAWSTACLYFELTFCWCCIINLLTVKCLLNISELEVVLCRQSLNRETHW